MAKNRVLPTPDPQDRTPGERAEAPMIVINEAISKAVFALYDGSKMTKRDAHDARVLAALWQIAYNQTVLQAQEIVNAKAIIETLNSPPCPGCGK